MQKSKRFNFVVVSVLVYSLVFAYGFMPAAKAASLESVSVKLSDSAPNISATSTIVINMGNANYLVEDEYIRVVYDSSFGSIPLEANITCPTGSTASTTPGSSDYVECVVDPGEFIEATTTQTIIVGKLNNPAAESPTGYLVTVGTYEADNDEIEFTETRVYIIEGVTVQAHVPASLTFDISPLGPASGKTAVNSVSLDASSTATAINFGDLVVDTRKTLGQALAVSTNATGGYIVTVEQDGEMENAAGATINSFRNSPDGTGSSTEALATTWSSPLGDINADFTYGYIGVTSDDQDLDQYTGDAPDFYNGGGGAVYAGLNGTDPLVVMQHDDVADGTTQNVGLAAVAYSIEITELQEAGDYSNTLTYICTPTY